MRKGLKTIFKMMMKKKLFLIAFGVFSLGAFNSTTARASEEKDSMYSSSVFMPIAQLCPSGLQYQTVCGFYGQGCNPTRCDGAGDT